MAWSLALVSLAWGTPQSVTGQVLQGQVLDSVSGLPVGAGFVVLVGSDGAEITRTLTTNAGRFVIRVGPERPGFVSLRSERIGYRVATTDPFRPPHSGTMQFIIRTHALPAQLLDLQVEETSECRMRPDEEEHTARAWEEARKALAAAAWTASQDLYQMVSNVYQRNLDRRGRRIETEVHRAHRGATASPFVSRTPEDLLSTGYVVDRTGSFDYFAPDAVVLQDPGFVETHCFRLTRSRSDTTLVGIAFEPTPSRALPDVAGVLWLNRRSFELRGLEYEYVNLPRAVRTSTDGGGGNLSFMSLPSGAWIVREWEIQIPMAIRSERVDRFDRWPRLIADAYRHDGGEVLTVTDPAGQRVYQAKLAELIVIVADSTQGEVEPVAGASVRIDGTWFVGETDDSGATHLSAPLDGDYSVTFSSRTTGALGYTPTPRPVALARGRRDTLWIDVPSTTDMMEALCDEPVMNRDFRMLVGTVRDGATGRPVPDAVVTATWQHIDEDVAMRFDYEDAYATSTTDDSGYYAICGLEFTRPTFVYAEGPAGGSVMLRVAFERDGVEVGDEFHATSEQFWRQDLVLW